MINVPEIDDLAARLRCGGLSRAAFLEASVRLTSFKVNCSRTGLWIFSEIGGRRRLQCVAMYDVASAALVTVLDRSEDGAAPYFEELSRRGHVMAHDARTHPATKGFFEADLRSRGVKSLMAASFALNGSLYGALTCTQLDQAIRWTPVQLGALIRIGSRISLAIASASPHQLDTFVAPL